MNPHDWPERADVLVIMAHPDDAEFSCGGTIARLCAEGKRIWYVLATNGYKGTEDRTMSPLELAVRQEIEQRNAAAALGAAACRYLGYPDWFLEDGLDTHKIGEAWLVGTDDPDYYMDVGDYFHQRIKAIDCHVSHVGKQPPEALEKRWQERLHETGKAAGMGYAESFRKVTFRR